MPTHGAVLLQALAGAFVASGAHTVTAERLCVQYLVLSVEI